MSLLYTRTYLALALGSSINKTPPSFSSKQERPSPPAGGARLRLPRIRGQERALLLPQGRDGQLRRRGQQQQKEALQPGRGGDGCRTERSQAEDAATGSQLVSSIGIDSSVNNTMVSLLLGHLLYRT